MASALTAPLFWLTLLGGAAGLLLIARTRRLRWLPALLTRWALLLLVLLAAFAPRQERAAELPRRQVLVVDQSDSLTEAARQLGREQAAAWASGGENRLVLAYGVAPQVVTAPAGAWPEVDGRGSDLGAALTLAGELLGAAPGGVTIATDGLASVPSAVDAALRELIATGHQIDTLALQARPAAGDGFVGRLTAPANVWAGTPFDVILPVYPPAAGVAPELELRVNGEVAAVTAELLEPPNYRFHLPPQGEGLLTLEARASFPEASGAPDPFPANNVAYATLQVFAAPQALFLTEDPAAPQVSGLIERLGQNGVKIEAIGPRGLPTRLDLLQSYRVIFINNLRADQFQLEQMKALEVFVTQLAGGLIFIGGNNAYTLGGYRGTVLEGMLPVKLEPPPRSERPPISFLLLLDRSSSMATTRLPGLPQPIALAREAAMRAIETMRPEDTLGVLSFTHDSIWDVPLRPLGDGLNLREALDAVSRVQASGTTHIYQALSTGLAGMYALPPDAPTVRNILLLSDGQSFDGSLEDFRALAASAQAQGITISTIALGNEADEAVMRVIAEAGKGRYYQVSEADDLPRIMIQESEAARAENIQSGQTAAKLVEFDHPLLTGLPLNRLPEFSGYNALTSRADDGAEDILLSASFDDPLLAVWQVGLGRVAAWTSDLGESWLFSWNDPQDEATFWTQVMRYTLANPALDPVQVQIGVTPAQLTAEVALLEEDGGPRNLAQVVFTYAEGSGQVRSFAAPQVAPGVYRAELPRPPEGAYRAMVVTSDAAGARLEEAAPFVVDPPEEWLPPDADAGRANLAAWASRGGGVALTAAEFSAASAPTAAADAARWPWAWNVLLALALLWPLEIAARKRWLPWAA
jgi:uncharacterized membrane protein